MQTTAAMKPHHTLDTLFAFLFFLTFSNAGMSSYMCCLHGILYAQVTVTGVLCSCHCVTSQCKNHYATHAHLIHNCPFAAVILQLSETDFSHREDQGSLGAVFEARGAFSGTVVVEITPMSVSDFLNQGLTPVPQVIADGNLHYATPGNDHILPIL